MAIAQARFQEIDLSTFVPAMNGIRAAIVLPMNKGIIGQAKLVTSYEKFIDYCGGIDPKISSAFYDVTAYLEQGPIWVARASHNTDKGRLNGKDPKYSGVLVRSKVENIPTSDIIPDPDFLVDPIVKPLKGGLTQHELDTYAFELYKTNREFEFKELVTFPKTVNEVDVVPVSYYDDFEAGDDVAFTPVIYTTTSALKGSMKVKVNDTVWVNPEQKIRILTDDYEVVAVDYETNEITLKYPLLMDVSLDFPIKIIPFNGSAVYNINELLTLNVDYDKLTLDKSIFANKGAPLRLVDRVENKLLSAVNVAYTDITVSSVEGKVISVNTVNGLVAGLSVSINDTEYIIASVNVDNNTITSKNKVPSDVVADMSVLFAERVYIDFADGIFVMEKVEGSNQIIVTNSDYIKNDSVVAFGSGPSNYENEAVIVSKDLYVREEKHFALDNAVNVNPNFTIWRMTQAMYEERDSFLVVSENQGVWGDKISISISPSKLEHAFFINVYYDGVLKESHQVSKRYIKDGFGRQLHLESVINGKSGYISVIDNAGDISNETGDPENPLLTNYSVWRQFPEDIFNPISNGTNEDGVEIVVVTEEDVIVNDLEVMVSNKDIFNLGERIKFSQGGSEYKVLNTKVDVQGNGVLILDRPIQERDKIANATEILRFDYIKYYPITKLQDKVYFNYHIPFSGFSLAGTLGVLQDGGANRMMGGDVGSAVTIGDMMNTLRIAYGNKSKTPFQLISDGGYAFPAYQQELIKFVEKRGDCFAYLSTSLDAELSNDYLSAIRDYRNSTMANTSYASMFTSHIRIYDAYNQMEVIAPSTGVAMAQQAFTEKNFAMYYPAAGWIRGKVMALGLVRELDDDEISYLNESQLNCLRLVEGKGIAIWGNDTLQTMPSMLSMRHVRMLMIVMKTGLQNYMDYQVFNLNRKADRDIILFNVEQFFASTIAPAVYNYRITDETSDADANNRRAVFRIVFSPVSDMEDIVSQLVVTSAGMDYGLVDAILG